VKRDYSKYLIAIGVVLLVLVLLAGIWYIATPR